MNHFIVGALAILGWEAIKEISRPKEKVSEILTGINLIDWHIYIEQLDSLDCDKQVLLEGALALEMAINRALRESRPGLSIRVVCRNNGRFFECMDYNQIIFSKQVGYSRIEHNAIKEVMLKILRIISDGGYHSLAESLTSKRLLLA